MRKTKRALTIGAAALLAVGLTSVAPRSAHAFHFTVINGVCYNPAGIAIPFVAAIHNPHCVGVSDPGGGGGGEGGGGGKGRHHRASKSKSNVGKAVVGCIMGSALGLITASIAKGKAYGYPMRWMSQAEYEASVKTRNKAADLTSQEAALIGFSCGLGALPVIAKYNQPVTQKVVVKAKY